MGLSGRPYIGLLVFLLLLWIHVPASAASEALTYTISYSIAPAPDGSALWIVEYRTLLPTLEDVAIFERDITDASVIPAGEVQQVMERSAANAAAATGRPMEIRNFSVASAVQATPTGTYGVVRYSFLWSGFADIKEKMVIGDAFVGGLYLSKETTLTIRPPQGFRVISGTPPADISRDDLTWYGLRSFEPGEPRIVLEPPAFPWLLAVLGVILILAGTGAAGVYIRRTKLPARARDPGTSDDPAARELASLEERIIRLLEENNRELYQSEIIARLGAPKSTISSALAVLHENGRIVKVRKGRENLIRLI
jgi:uncharacterized membrane protein